MPRQPRGSRQVSSTKVPGATPQPERYVLEEAFPGTNDSKRKARGQTQPVIPKLTPKAALEFVKLVHTGIGPDLAVRYLVPSISTCETIDEDEKEELCAAVAARWYRDHKVLRAINIFNGGNWQDLDAERRLSIARDKSYAELAHYLYSHNYEHLQGIELKKYNDALGTISEFLSGKDGADSPFEAAIRNIADKMKVAPQDLAANMPTMTGTKQ